MYKVGYNEGVGFYRSASIQILSQLITAADWKSFLNKDSAFLSKVSFKYDPENFLYFRARTISGGEKHGPNGNGDYFPWKELLAAFETFIGKGFYLNHNSDSIENAKGILLDAIPVYDEEYLECLVAIDRTLAPDVCRQIKSNILNAVSMGCIAQEAECGVCHNVAHNEAELCKHMRQGTADFTKGKEYLGAKVEGSSLWKDKVAYEINRNLLFTELSGVTTGADHKAHIFEIIGTPLEDKFKNMIAHYHGYQETKGADLHIKAKETELKIEAKDMCYLVGKAEEVDSAIGYLKGEFGWETKLKWIDENITIEGDITRVAIVLNETTIEQAQKMLDKKKIAAKIVLEASYGDVYILRDIKDGMSDEDIIKKIRDRYEKITDDEAKLIIDNIKETGKGDWDKVVKDKVEAQEEADENHKKEVERIKQEMPALKNKLRKDIKNEIHKERKANKENESNKDDGLALGNGYILRTTEDVPEGLVELYDNEAATGIFVELVETEMSDADKVSYYRKLLMLKDEAEEVETEETKSRREQEMKIKGKEFVIKYEDAETGDLKDNYFKATQGDEVKRVKATYIIPLDIQRKIEAAFKEDKVPEDVCTVEEMIEQITTECKSSMLEFRKFVRAEKRKAFGRTATWEGGVMSVNPDEESKNKKPARGDVIKSVNPAEEKKDKAQLPAPQTGKAGARVKKYYNELASTGPGGDDVVHALKVNSKLKKENESLTAKLKETQDNLETIKSELVAIKEIQTVRADSEVIASIVSAITAGQDVPEEKTKDLINSLAQIDNGNLIKVKSLFEKLGTKDLNEIEIENEEEDSNLPVLTAGQKLEGEDPAQKLSDGMVRNSKKKGQV